MSLETLPSRQELQLNSTQSVGEWFKKTTWNIFVGTALIAGSIWVLLHFPIIPTVHPDAAAA